MFKWPKTILYIILSAVVAHLLPFSAFFKNIDTLIHEFGHAMVTLALSGQVMSIELYADHSGITRSAVTDNGAMIPIGLAGYMIASLFTWFLFVMYARGKQRIGITVTAVIAVAALVLFVRNGFGFTWLLGFTGLNLLILVFGGNRVSGVYLLVIAFLSLEESVFGPLWLNVAAVLRPEEAGDAAILNKITAIPTIVWSLWFTLFALWCAKQAITAFVGRTKKTKLGVKQPFGS
jgi:hypothetical protein